MRGHTRNVVLLLLLLLLLGVICWDAGKGTVSDPIVIDLSSDEEDEEDLVVCSSWSASAPSSSQTPHIVNPSSHAQPSVSPSSSSSSCSRRDPLCYEACRQGSSSPLRSVPVTVKRRYSSTTDGGPEAIDPLSVTPPPPSTISTNTTGTSASTNHINTASIPVPVITEYAPTLPYFSVAPPSLSYLAPPSIRTILASSADPLTSNGSGVSGGEVNIDDLRLNREFFFSHSSCVFDTNRESVVFSGV